MQAPAHTHCGAWRQNALFVLQPSPCLCEVGLASKRTKCYIFPLVE